jgi:menaquinone-9 beta-reductase
MSNYDADALIVGAGPAGLAAAIVLGRHGLKVVVCDCDVLPRDKACGEGVMPTGVAHLEQLGAGRYLDPRHLRRLSGIQFHTAGGSIGTARFAEGHGLGIRRTNLSSALLQAAGDWPTVELREQTRVRQLEREADRFRVRLSTGEITTRLIVGADGLNSRVRRWAGLEGPRQRLRRLGARQHFAVAPVGNFVEVVQGHGIEAYITPCGNDEVGVAFLWDAAMFRRAEGGRGLIGSLLEGFANLKKRFELAPPSSAPLSSGPLHRVARHRVARGVALVGDAGGYLDACTGEGISIALAQALALESTVAPLMLASPGMPDGRQLSGYARACRQITRSYEIGTRLQLYLCRHPRLADRVVRALSEQDLLGYFVPANMGTANFWPGWRRAVRLAGSICRPPGKPPP